MIDPTESSAVADELATSIRFEAPENAQVLGTGSEYTSVWWLD